MLIIVKFDYSKRFAYATGDILRRLLFVTLLCFNLCFLLFFSPYFFVKSPSSNTGSELFIFSLGGHSPDGSSSARRLRGDGSTLWWQGASNWAWGGAKDLVFNAKIMDGDGAPESTSSAAPSCTSSVGLCYSR